MKVSWPAAMSPWSIVLMFCVLTAVSSVPSRKPSSLTPTKREVKASEMDAIFKDDSVPMKRKRSEEGIMFGNQQNKPSGMIDGGLSGIDHQKSGEEDTTKNKSTNSTGNSPVEEVSRELLREPSLASDILLSPAFPQVSRLDDLDDKAVAAADLDLPEGQPPLLDGVDDPGSVLKYRDAENFLTRNWEAPLGDSRDTEGLQFSNDVFSRRRRRNTIQKRFRKRSVRTPIEELLSFKRRIRMKRDSPETDENILQLLELLAAAEVAKERQDAREKAIPFDLGLLLANLLEEAEAGEDGSEVDRYSERLPPPEIVPQALDGEEYRPVIAYPGYRMRRTGSWFPPVDYRVIGLPGQRRKRLGLQVGGTHFPSQWGRFEDKRRKLLSTMLDDDDDDSEDDANDIKVDNEPNLPLNVFSGAAGTNREENDGDRLYSLGELLSNDEAEDNNELSFFNSPSEAAATPIFRRVL